MAGIASNGTANDIINILGAIAKVRKEIRTTPSYCVISRHSLTPSRLFLQLEAARIRSYSPHPSSGPRHSLEKSVAPLLVKALEEKKEVEGKMSTGNRLYGRKEDTFDRVVQGCKPNEVRDIGVAGFP